MGAAIGLNENTFGMRMAIGAMIALFLLMKKDEKIKKALVIIFIIVFSGLTLLSGSKKGLILLVTGLLVVIYIYSAGKQKLRRFFGALILVMGLLFLVFNNSVLYSTIGNRIERTVLTSTGQNSNSSRLQVINGTVGTTDLSLVERDYYRDQAIMLFKKYPAFGYGGNGFVTHMREIGYSHVAYSHNNYTELLCTLGIVGFVIYYSYWIILIVRLWNIKKQTQDEQVRKTAALFLALLIIFLVLDYGYVSYVLEFNMFILCLADIFARLSRKEIENEAKR